MGVASAQAATTYYVTTTGDDTNPCTQAQPCLTIARGLAAHRAAASPGDVVDVGAGTFAENVTADQASDNGLTIRGTLSGTTRSTTIRGSGSGTPFGGSCRDSACAVTLGRGSTTAVKLQDVNVDTNADGNNLTAVSIVGGSDLSDVDASLGAGSNAFDAVSQGSTGTVIDHSTLDGSNGTFTAALSTDADPTITDSHIVAGPTLGAIQAGNTGTMSITRTWIETSPTGNTAGINSNGVSVTLDSSLITGGFVGVTVAANGGNQTVQVRNTTVDVGQPGMSDNANDFSIGPQSGGNADVTIDSSLLAENVTLDTFAPPATGSLTCTHSDIQNVTVGAGFTDNCVLGSDGNTTTDPANQFVGGSPFSWQLKAGAPAIDTGSPGPLPAGQSTHDLAGNPRIQTPTSADCPGIRDMGAYEFAGAVCIPQNKKAPSITNGTSPVAGTTKLGSNVGRWAPPGTSYTREWLRCDPSNVDDCTVVSGKTHSTYQVTNDDAGYVIRLRVVANSAFGSSDPATSAPTGTVAGSVPVVKTAPTISGPNPPTVGSQLTSYRGTWSGSPTTYFRYWLRCDPNDPDPNDCASIGSGGYGTTYRVRNADVGSVLRVQVYAENSAGFSDPAYSDPTAVVPAS